MLLFLANYTLWIAPYMQDSYEEQHQTLVWADDAEQAEQKVRDRFDLEDPYSISKTVMSVGLIPAIV